MSSGIQYTTKPDWLSWDEIQECQFLAHASNRKNGLHMHCQELTGVELEQNIGDGVCFVAIKGRDVIGTCSVKIIGKLKRWSWWNKDNRCAYFCMDAVLPEYQGKHVYSELQKMRYEYVRSHGLNVIEIDTAEYNINMLSLLKRQGFQKVSFSAYKNCNYYSIILAKWIDSPPSRFVIFIRYALAYIITIIIWKRSRITRFPFNLFMK